MLQYLFRIENKKSTSPAINTIGHVKQFKMSTRLNVCSSYDNIKFAISLCRNYKVRRNGYSPVEHE